MVNATSFDLKEFPKDVVEVYLKGGAGPAVVTMRKRYTRAKPGWCERAIDWLEKNVDHGPEFAPVAQKIVWFKVGDHGAVCARGAAKQVPGAQIVRVVGVMNDGRVLRVKDIRAEDKTYYVLYDQLVPVPAPV